MEQNLNNNNPNNSFFQKCKNLLHSIFFDLPFDNYHSLYKTGKIKNMDIEEKKQLIYTKNNANIKKLFFAKLISIRPTILDDDDYIEYNNIVRKNKYEKGVIILGFFGLNSWTFYMVSIKKKKFLAQFMFVNFLLIFSLYYSGHKLQSFIDKMYLKYDKEIVNDEMEQKLNMLFKKD